MSDEQSPLGPPAQVKRLGHKAALLELMRAGGWHHMDVLREVGGWRYGARLFELKRDAGWDYEKRRIGVDVFEYRLFPRASQAASADEMRRHRVSCGAAHPAAQSVPPPPVTNASDITFTPVTEGSSTIIAASLPLLPRTRPRLSQCWRGTIAEYNAAANARPGWWIQFGFDVVAINYLKRAVPMEDRTWVKERRLWWIAEAHVAVLREIFSNFEAFEGQTPLF